MIESIIERIGHFLKKAFKVPTLSHGTSAEWRTYRTTIKNQFPVYSKLIEILEWIDIQCAFVYRIWCDKIKYPIIHRTTQKYHIIDTKLPPAYYGADTQMLHACFSILVDFVEHECAWMYHITSDELNDTKFKPNRENGLKYLAWEASLTYDGDMGVEPTDEKYLKPTPQALAAKETAELYIWWKDVFEKRVNAYNMYWDKKFGDEEWSDIFNDMSYSPTKFDLMQELDDKYEAEEEEMLIRLMKNRRCLWT